LHDARIYARIAPLARGAGLYAGLAALAGTHFASQHNFGSDNGWIEALYTTSIAWVLIGLVVGRPVWARLLELRPVRWIGQRAYGVYLVHVACIWIAEIYFRPGSGNAWRMAGAYLTAVVLSLLVAELLFRIVERPMMIGGKRLSARILAGGAPPVAAADPQPAARAAGAS
jgi:peptidoglycan/LPS O-acetylase OafA/YrhL